MSSDEKNAKRVVRTLEDLEEDLRKLDRINYSIRSDISHLVAELRSFTKDRGTNLRSLYESLIINAHKVEKEQKGFSDSITESISLLETNIQTIKWILRFKDHPKGNELSPFFSALEHQKELFEMILRRFKEMDKNKEDFRFKAHITIAYQVKKEIEKIEPLSYEAARSEAEIEQILQRIESELPHDKLSKTIGM